MPDLTPDEKRRAAEMWSAQFVARDLLLAAVRERWTPEHGCRPNGEGA